VHLLLQYYYLFLERQKAQLFWSCCINTKSRPGANVPNDLHMEHLNWRLKIVLRGLEANSTPTAVVRAGSIVAVQHVCNCFEEQTTRSSLSDRHLYLGFGKDFSMILSGRSRIFERGFRFRLIKVIERIVSSWQVSMSMKL